MASEKATRRRQLVELLNRYEPGVDYSGWSPRALESKLRELKLPQQVPVPSASVDPERIQAGSLI